MGKHAEALDRFKAIYADDIGFRDVAERVERLYQVTKQGGGQG
jgi:hypothetical protein